MLKMRAMKPTVDDAMVRNQTGLRYKGYSVAAPSGGSVQKIDLTGVASVFEGLAVRAALDTTRLTLRVNSDIVVDDVAAGFFLVSQDNPERFVPVQRYLMGTDSIELVIQNSAAADPFELIVAYRESIAVQ